MFICYSVHEYHVENIMICEIIEALRVCQALAPVIKAPDCALRRPRSAVATCGHELDESGIATAAGPYSEKLARSPEALGGQYSMRISSVPKVPDLSSRATYFAVCCSLSPMAYSYRSPNSSWSSRASYVSYVAPLPSCSTFGCSSASATPFQFSVWQTHSPLTDHSRSYTPSTRPSNRAFQTA
jgi:hypothetical protein